MTSSSSCLRSWNSAREAALIFGMFVFLGVLTGVGSIPSDMVVVDDRNGCKWLFKVIGFGAE